MVRFLALLMIVVAVLVAVPVVDTEAACGGSSTGRIFHRNSTSTTQFSSTSTTRTRTTQRLRLFHRLP